MRVSAHNADAVVVVAADGAFVAAAAVAEGMAANVLLLLSLLLFQVLVAGGLAGKGVAGLDEASLMLHAALGTAMHSALWLLELSCGCVDSSSTGCFFWGDTSSFTRTERQ